MRISAILAVSFMIPAFATAAPKDEDGVPQVNIANTPDVNVVNTPDVNISNSPDVNIVNTPDVNISNSPDVNIANTPGVEIMNAPPLVVVETLEESPPFILKYDCLRASVRNSAACRFSESVTPPQGFVFSIERYTGIFSLNNAGAKCFAAVAGYMGTDGIDRVQVTDRVSSTDTFYINDVANVIMSTQTTVRFDEIFQIDVVCSPGRLIGSAGNEFVVMGRLVPTS